MKTIKLIVDIRGGIVQAIYGDSTPEDVQLEFIVRDHDSIALGEEDPIKSTYYPEIYYW